jgi:translation initiation factor IF-2
MSIEQLIAENTAALVENTRTLREVLAASASTTPAVAATPAPTPAPAPAKAAKKAAKLEVVETPTPEPVAEETKEPEAPAAEETPAPVVEEAPAPESTEPVNRDETILEISQEVKGWLGRSGANMAANMAKYTELRAKWGIQKVTDLEDDKLLPFFNDIKKMIGA